MADPTDPLSQLEEGLEPRNPGSAGRSPTLPPATSGMFGGEGNQAPQPPGPQHGGLAGFLPGQGPDVASPMVPGVGRAFPVFTDYQRYATPNPAAAATDYEDFGLWDEFMVLPAWRRVLDYAEITNRMQYDPTGVSDRSRRMLAWGLQNDDEAINMLNKRGENNWFQVGNWLQGAALVDFIVPGDINAVTSSEAHEITSAWDELGPHLTAASSVLTPDVIEGLRDNDRYFNDQWNKASSNLVGDEQYVDMDDGERPDHATAYYNSGGEIFRESVEAVGWALDWLPLITTVKLGTKVGVSLGANIASAGIGRGTVQTAASMARTGATAIRHPVATGMRAATPALTKHGEVVKAWQATRFRTWLGRQRAFTATRDWWGGPGREIVPMLGQKGPRFTGRGLATGLAAQALGVTAAQSAYDLWLREVPSATVAEYQRDHAAIQANVREGIASGVVVADRLQETAQALVDRQVRLQSDWRDQQGQATTPSHEAEPTATDTPATTPTWGPLAVTPGTSAAAATETDGSAAAGEYGVPTPELTAPGLQSTTPMTLEGVPPPSGWTELDAISSYATGGATGTAVGPPPLLGGMEDEWQRDANGNLLADSKGNPIPNPGMYAKQGSYQADQFGQGLGGGYPRTYPQYRSGDEVAQIEAMSPAQIMSLTAKMRAAGYEIGAEYSFAGGRMNGALVEQFAALLTTANWNGTTWEDQLEFEQKAAAKMQRDIMDQNMTQYSRYRYLAPDYDTLAQGAKQQIRDNLGRDPTEAEIELYADAFRNVDRKSQRQQYRTDRATYRQNQLDELAAQGITPTTRERIEVPVEDPSTGGIRAGPGGKTKPMLVDRPIEGRGGGRGSMPGGTNIDVEASMAEWFERNYGDEVDMREAMDQAATNFVTMTAGSSALTNRVRQG